MTESLGSLESIDIVRILELLPHRYPFLLVDKIINIQTDQSAVGIKNVTINEPYFQGHFPDYPVMPGVLIIESMAQTAGAFCLHHLNVTKRSLVYFMTIDKAMFRKPVLPGDCLELHVQMLKKRGNIYRFGCKAIVRGTKVAEAQISAMVDLSRNTKEKTV